MGRVYEALKRAAGEGGADKKGDGRAAAPRVGQDLYGEGAPAAPVGVTNGAHGEAREREREAPPPRTPALFHAPEGAHESAPAEHIDAATVGSALPGGQASRVAGATAGAVGSTRAAELPALEVSAARVEPHLIAITEPHSPHAEQYRSLRTRVLHAGERRRLQSVVVTSAGVMEGKTITALNLAWLLAQTDGVRALLVDGDLRHPCAADYLSLDAPVGLSEVLAGEAALQETIVRLDPAGLYLLPGGGTSDDAAELLSGPKFSAVLAELRHQFDYIIIDAPPLAVFTDATVLINRADGALVVVRANKTKFSTLDHVLEPLPRERLLGVVLNGADDQLGESDYYYQRRYYRQEEKQVTAEE